MRRTVAVIVLVLMSGAAHAVIIQNYLSNPGFDGGTSGWVLVSPGFGVSSRWQAVDAIGSSHSGSILATAPGQAAAGAVVARQCLGSLPPAGQSYALSLRIRHHGIAPNNANVAMVYFIAGSGCSGATAAAEAVYTGATPENTWVTVQLTGIAPASFTSVEIELLTLAVSGTPTRVEYDDVYFGPAAPPSCTPGSGVLCVNDAPGDARFRIFGSYSTAQGGGSTGGLHAIDLSSLGVAHGGLMWFFAADNPELLIKVLNACTLNQRYWVFVSAGTNVNVELYVGDTHSGKVDYYHNPDTSAFPAV
ncbi:MAG: hypothetical protein ACM3OB_03530, partial [Acidobacteriota bacterium]